MKKLITAILALSLCFCTACSEKTLTPNTDSNPATSSTTEQIETTKPTQEDHKDIEISEDLPYVHKIPEMQFYINVPNLQEVQCGYTQLFVAQGSRFVAITVAKEDTVSTPIEAKDVCVPLLARNILSFSIINDLYIEEDSTEVINGREVYHYEGKFEIGKQISNREKAYDIYGVGYSFVLDDGTPVSIIGAVTDEEQPEDLIKEVRQLVEEMMKSARTEK